MIPAPTITRRGFVQSGGALFVTLCLASIKAQSTGADSSSAAVGRAKAWIEIRGDNKIVVRTGRTEIGTGMSAYYAQMVAEELDVAPEDITLVMGDTDKTPDGGYSAGFLTGALNVRKVAAYTRGALLALASDRLHVPVTDLSVSQGVISHGAQTIKYSDLVQGQELDLKIPVTGTQPRFAAMGSNSIGGLDWGGMDGLTVAGDPPLKSAKSYKVIGKSHPIPGIPDKVTGNLKWSCDVRLPNMLHARMIRPAGLGSALTSVGELDPARFPNSSIVRKKNLLAVVSSDEWEAISATSAVAAKTQWTIAAALPDSTSLRRTIQEHPWGSPDATKGNRNEVSRAIEGNDRILAAVYELPYIKHAPIGPYVAVADVRSDEATVWTHSAHSQALRARIANLLGLAAEKVTVRWLEHAGQFGRTTFGGDGAEADAAILSKLTGKPVRVQWSLQDDLAWSAASPAFVAELRGVLNSQKRIAAVEATFRSPHMMDPRPLGALLAEMPAGTAKPSGFLAIEWIYDGIGPHFEQIYAMNNLGVDTPSGGIRGLIMRTPGQRQQNFALECFMNEAASAAGTDPIEFRLSHTTDKRMIGVLQATAQAAGWEARSSPGLSARRTGKEPLRGRGVACMRRTNAYWVGIADIQVIPDTGVIQVLRFTIGVDCGTVINPRQLNRCMRGGVVMGLSEALKEELTFDGTKVTSTDWNRYRILTMAETPEIKVIQLPGEDRPFGAGGEAPNALPPAALVGAVFDATGVAPRKLPLKPDYVKTLLKG
jgi:nicotinate dehydrogenase subunit B